MSQVIKQLTIKGFIKLQTRSQDARKKTITITDAGHAAYSNALSKIDVDVKAFAAKFSLADMQHLYELSGRFRRIFEKHT